MPERKIDYIVRAARWFDKVNGNTYHSVNIRRVADNARLYHDWTYGYGEHYKQTALVLMAANNWIPEKYKEEPYMFERENNYPIEWFVTDGLKRDMVANGRP